jgi:hypothetical protein
MSNIKYNVYYKNTNYIISENPYKIEKSETSQPIIYTSFGLIILGVIILVGDYIIDIFNNIRGAYYIIMGFKSSNIQKRDKGFRLSLGLTKSNILRSIFGFGLIGLGVLLFSLGTKKSPLSKEEDDVLKNDPEFMDLVMKSRERTIKMKKKEQKI